MKKPTEKFSVNTRTVEKDVNTLLQTEDCLPPETDGADAEPTINLERALQLFDNLQEAISNSLRPSREPKWSHASVLALGEPDPASAIILRARRLVLGAIERGWAGPPYNPFDLAELQGIKLLPTEQIADAETRSDSAGKVTIKFNPHRPPARMRFSIAHELGHYLFPDCAAATRHRATHQEMKDDDWQLESLCNMAAAEILMPFGTLRENLSTRPSVDLVLELRRKYLVSCEAVFNRLLRLSVQPCVGFIARYDNITSRYFIEYRISSSGLEEKFTIHRGYVLPHSSKVSKCSAIGAIEREDARWISRGASWFVEYLGISPNAGETYPRVLALAFPPATKERSIAELLRFIPGNALDPFGAEPKLLLQVVNDQAQIWGGGFAKQVRKKWPEAQAHFRQWTYGRHNLKLGNAHTVGLRDDLTLVSLVAQHGFGKATSGPRLRYGALFSALEKVADLASTQGASIHMPRIGTGEAGGSWNIVEGIIQDALVSRGIRVTIYDLPPGELTFPGSRRWTFLASWLTRLCNQESDDGIPDRFAFG